MREQLEHFLDEGLITDVIRVVKTGKEASVHLCRGNESTTGERLLAAKVYRPRERRDFRDDGIYRAGNWIKERRVRDALEKKTRFGREADLSAYNVLVWEGSATLIDLPQAVDPRKNPHAKSLLERDVRNVCSYFERAGVRSDPARIARDLWTAWLYADLVPEELRRTLELDPLGGYL